MLLIEKRKIDVNGRIQIPSAMREEMGLKDGDEVAVMFQDSKITLSKAFIKESSI